MASADDPSNPEYPQGESEFLRLLTEARANRRVLTVAEELDYLTTLPPRIRSYAIRAMRQGKRGPTITPERYLEMAAEKRVARLYTRFRSLLPNPRRGKAIPLSFTVNNIVDSVLRDASIRPHKRVEEIVRRLARAGLPNRHERTIRNWIKRRTRARKLSI